MSIPAKGVGILSLASCIHDIHRTSLITAEKYKQKACANSILSTSVGCQKTNFLSYKDTKRKNYFSQNNPFFIGFEETMGSVKGYLKGVKNGILRYYPNFILSILSILPSKKMKIFSDTGLLKNKHNIIANIAAAALGIIEISDFIVNGTKYGEKKDYLE